MGGLKVCPKCGRPGYLFVSTINGRPYFYMSHKIEGNKRKKCYLSPAEAYRVASKFHPFTLEGIIDPETGGLNVRRYKKYLINLLETLRVIAEDIAEGKKALLRAEEIRELVSEAQVILKEIAETLAKPKAIEASEPKAEAKIGEPKPEIRELEGEAIEPKPREPETKPKAREIEGETSLVEDINTLLEELGVEFEGEA